MAEEGALAHVGGVLSRVGLRRALLLLALRPLGVEGKYKAYHAMARWLSRVGVKRMRVDVNGARVFVDPRSYFALRHLIVSRY